jgi:hypothetical protein
MSQQELPSRSGNAANRWTPKWMSILSLAAFLGCTIIWLILLGVFVQAKAVAGQEFPDVRLALFAMTLMLLLIILASIGCLLALIGLAYEAIARRRFHRLLALSLALNVLAGPIPFLCIWVSNRKTHVKPPPLHGVAVRRALYPLPNRRVSVVLGKMERVPKNSDSRLTPIAVNSVPLSF